MKIVLLCGYYYPESVGGTEAYVQMLAHDLQQMGHEVTVAAPSGNGKPRSYTHDSLSVFRYPVNPSPDRAEVQGKRDPKYIDRWSNWLKSEARRGPHALAHARMQHGACPGGSLRRVFRSCYASHAGRALSARYDDAVGHYTLRRGSAVGALWRLRFAEERHALAGRLGDECGFSCEFGSLRTGPAGTALQQAALIRQQKNDVMVWLQSAEHVVVVAGWLKEVLMGNGISAEHITVSPHGLSDARRCPPEGGFGAACSTSP